MNEAVLVIEDEPKIRHVCWNWNYSMRDIRWAKAWVVEQKDAWEKYAEGQWNR